MDTRKLNHLEIAVKKAKKKFKAGKMTRAEYERLLHKLGYTEKLSRIEEMEEDMDRRAGK